MNARYIQRCRLQARQYTPGCPVVLTAGALLEDTRQPRLVAQLKLQSLSPAPIAAVTVRCHAGAEALHTYRGLSVERGQSFGTYTAIPLPLSDARRLTVSVESVVFADGTSWTLPSDAQWGVLPPFRALEEPLAAFAGEHLPGGRYACAAPADLWYCACGGVNREGETVCHRCGASRERVFQYADPAGALYRQRQEELAERQRQEEAARREAEARAAAVRAAEREAARQAAEEKAAAAKAAAVEKAAQLKARLGEKAPKKLNKKRLALGGVLAALLVLAVVLVPKFLGGSGDIQIKPPVNDGGEQLPEILQPEKTPEIDLPGTGTMNIDLAVNENGRCPVRAELIREFLPEVQTIDFQYLPPSGLGTDIDDYLTHSFQMSTLMRGDSASEVWGDFDPNQTEAVFCLLLFDADTHLMGYFLGRPETLDNGLQRFAVTLCDYDFAALYEREKAAFDAEKDALYAKRIPLEDVYDCGAAYYLRGIDSSNRHEETSRDDHLMYQLWDQMGSPYLDRWARPMDRFAEEDHSYGNFHEDLWRFFILLDENKQYLGYVIQNGGEELSEPGDGASVPEEPGDGASVPEEPGDGASVPEEPAQEAPTSGTVNIDVPYTESEKCKVTPELVQQVIPHAKFISFEGTPDLGGDIDDYLADSFQVAIRMEGGDADGEWGTFDPKGDSKSTFCLLVFDGSTHLAGYFVGVPKKVDGSTWRLEVTLCDYDFSGLVEERKAAFEAELDTLCANYIPLDQVKSSGAKYCLEGWYTGRSADLRDDPIQAYHMWNQLTSPHVEKFARDLDRIDRRQIREGRYVGFLLLDKNYELIGYTMKG